MANSIGLYERDSTQRIFATFVNQDGSDPTNISVAQVAIEDKNGSAVTTPVNMTQLNNSNTYYYDWFVSGSSIIGNHLINYYYNVDGVSGSSSETIQVTDIPGAVWTYGSKSDRTVTGLAAALSIPNDYVRIDDPRLDYLGSIPNIEKMIVELLDMQQFNDVIGLMKDNTKSQDEIFQQMQKIDFNLANLKDKQKELKIQLSNSRNDKVFDIKSSINNLENKISELKIIFNKLTKDKERDMNQMILLHDEFKKQFKNTKKTFVMLSSGLNKISSESKDNFKDILNKFDEIGNSYIVNMDKVVGDMKKGVSKDIKSLSNLNLPLKEINLMVTKLDGDVASIKNISSGLETQFFHLKDDIRNVNKKFIVLSEKIVDRTADLNKLITKNYENNKQISINQVEWINSFLTQLQEDQIKGHKDIIVSLQQKPNYDEFNDNMDKLRKVINIVRIDVAKYSKEDQNKLEDGLRLMEYKINELDNINQYRDKQLMELTERKSDDLKRRNRNINVLNK